MQLSLAPCSFLVFCEMRRHLSRYRHCRRGSKVPAYPRTCPPQRYVKILTLSKCNLTWIQLLMI